MTIAATVVLCVVLFVLALLFPLASRGPQRGVGRAFSLGARAGRRAPGPAGRLLSTPFRSSRAATDGSAGAGRGLRGRLPL